MTTKFELVEKEIGEFDWQLLSIEMRRMYMVFLSDTQHPRQLTSYGNIICDRETPKKVSKLSGAPNNLLIFIPISRLSTQLSHTL